MSAEIPLCFSIGRLPIRSSRFSPRMLCLGRHFVCVLLAVAWLLNAPALVAKKQKAPTTKSVSGVVTDKSEKAISGAEVTLKDLQTGKVVAIYAEADGGYQFSDLDPHHDYEIKASFKGVASESRQVSSIDTRWKVVINLVISPPSS